MNGHHNGQNGFSYTYSAREQAEIRRIREKYVKQSEREAALLRLRRLDASVTGTAQAVALVLGIVGALLFGFGMSLILSELGSLMGLGAGACLVLAVFLGAAGGILAGLAYPAYRRIEKKKKEKIAPLVLRLSDELLQ